MADIVDKKRRSEIMGRVRNKDTKPELVVRRITHAMGYRYRLHYGKLPGRPDLAFPSRKKAIFVHGCFWHRHEGCDRTRMPKTRVDFWADKFSRNIARDKENLAKLECLGWETLVIWECQTESPEYVAELVGDFLSS